MVSLMDHNFQTDENRGLSRHFPPYHGQLLGEEVCWHM
jgi:hypothetical protein